MKNILLIGAACAVLFAGCSHPSTNAGAGSSASSGHATKSAAPMRIAHGQEVNLQDYVVPGKTTIVEFGSEYCPPCVAIAPRLKELHASHADIVVVEVDINRPEVKGIDWRSPVALQYGVQLTPSFKVYGPDGKLQAEGDAAGDLVFSMLK